MGSCSSVQRDLPCTVVQNCSVEEDDAQNVLLKFLPKPFLKVLSHLFSKYINK